MGHGHVHHHHSHDEPADLPPVLDTSIPDEALSPGEVSRRTMLRGAGLLGAGAAAASVLAAPGAAAAAAQKAATGSTQSRQGGYLWLAGDHHIHTQYSPDAMYRVIDHVRH